MIPPRVSFVAYDALFISFPTAAPPGIFLAAAAAVAAIILPISPFLSVGTLRRTTSIQMPSPRSSPPPSFSFTSPESLSEWLRPRLPPGSLSSWGPAPGSKTVHNLWLEISHGETSLLLPEPSAPPLRSVHVATVRMRNSSGSTLLESHQLLSDGSVRRRCRPLSEKMKPGESVEDAALRAVREEIGDNGKVRIRPGSYEVRVEERVSESYPGLLGRYVIHSVEAEHDGLPQEGEFSTEETGEFTEGNESHGNAIFVKKHFWKWVDDYDGVHP